MPEYQFNLLLAEEVQKALDKGGFARTVLLNTFGPARESLFKRVAAANALDADHLQKVGAAKVLREDDHWVLEVEGGGDLTLERLASMARADLLIEVFGRRLSFREGGGRP